MPMHTYLYIFICICMDVYLSTAYDKYLLLEAYNYMIIDVTVVKYLDGFKYVPIHVFMCMYTCTTVYNYM